MHRDDIILAWKDEEYRASLGDDERASLPPHPAGAVDLSDESIGEAGGYTINMGCIPITVITAIFDCIPTGNITMSCCANEQ